MDFVAHLIFLGGFNFYVRVFFVGWDIYTTAADQNFVLKRGIKDSSFK